MTDRHGSHESGRYRVHLRPLVLGLALLLLAGLGIGTTAALLLTRTDPVQNDFIYGKVTSQVEENFSKENNVYIKRDVKIRNTGNTSAYIRVLLVFTWKDEEGNVFVNKPVENRDFQINLALSNGWIVSRNDVGAYLYYKYPVAPGEATPILIDSVRQEAGVTGPENGKYALSVEIVADAVQAEPAEAVQDAWEEVAVDAGGAITVQGGITYENESSQTEGE